MNNSNIDKEKVKSHREEQLLTIKTNNMEKTFNPNQEPAQELRDKIDNIDTARMLVISRMGEHYNNGDEMYIENIDLLRQAYFLRKRIKGILDNKSQLELDFNREEEKT